MKPRNLVILVTFALSACQAVQLPTTASPALESVTAAASKTPTPTPEATPAASPTPEGPYEGQTRFKEGVGEQVYTVIRDKEGNIMYAEWVRVKTPGDGIPMFDFTSKDYYGYRTLGHVQVYCSDGLEGCADVPKFTHIDKLPENLNDEDLSALMKVKLFKRLNNGRMPTGQEMSNFLADHPNGFDINFFVNDPEHLFTWALRPGSDSSVKVILTDWDDPILEGGKEIGIDSYFSLRSKILGVDEDGRLIGVVAVNKFPPAGAEYIWNDVMFLHSAMVFQQEDVTNIRKHTVLSDMRISSERKSVQGNPWIITEPDK